MSPVRGDLDDCQPRAAGPTAPAVIAMAAKTTRSTAVLKRHLRELVNALDKRVPHVEREGEAQIAADSRALKEKALQRLAELDKKP